MRYFIVFVVGLVASVQEWAQPLFAHAESIESTVANVDLVVTAKLVKFGGREQADGREVHEAKIAIEDTLKQDLFTLDPYELLKSGRIDEFMQAASVSGIFLKILSHVPERWPKVQHKETGIQVDILPEGQHPGLPPDLAPTTIPSPAKLGAEGKRLRYMGLPQLIELKIAAGRLKDKADVVELIRANPAQADIIRAHLSGVHTQYVAQFDALVEEARRNNSQR